MQSFTIRKSGTWVREVEAPISAQPSTLEAVKAFKEILSVSQDKQTGFVTAYH